MPGPANLGPISSIAAKLMGLHSGDSWRDRIKPAAYTSPITGTRVPFEFVDVSRSFDIRGTAFDFPGVNNSYVQQTGFSSRKYPLVCYFTGKNCDIEAGAFEAALMETGLGKLEHPMYGTIDALPFGTVERADALATASNQSVVTVTFWTSIPAIYPSAATGGADEIAGSLELFNAAVAAQFSGNTSFITTLRKASAIGTIKALLKTVKSRLGQISDSVASVRNKFGQGLTAINGGLDVLIGGPLLLAQQISNLIQFPARALAGLSSRLDAYARLAEDIFGSDAGSPATALSSASILVDHQAKVANDFHIASLVAMNAVAGSVLSTIAQPITATANGLTPIFGSRTQILNAAAAVIAQMDAMVAWRDGGFAALTTIDDASQAIDTGEAYAALQDVVARTAGYLIQASFSAQPERALVLDRERTIVDVCAEVYGAVDSKLDLLISTNDFTGDEILELPIGRRVVYYPDQAA
jgi:prophage DNA circulation protein